jgi:hypothetical protein
MEYKFSTRNLDLKKTFNFFSTKFNESTTNIYLEFFNFGDLNIRKSVEFWGHI